MVGERRRGEMRGAGGRRGEERKVERKVESGGGRR